MRQSVFDKISNMIKIGLSKWKVSRTSDGTKTKLGRNLISITDLDIDVGISVVVVRVNIVSCIRNKILDVFNKHKNYVNTKYKDKFSY